MTLRSFGLALGLMLSVTASGCAAATSSSGEGDGEGDAFGELTSVEATFLDFRFSGTVVAPNGVVPRQAIISQLYYTEGRLTHLGGNSRPGFVVLTDVRSVPAEEAGFQKITYKASLPVLWPANQAQPTRYEVAGPTKVDQPSLDAFNAKYDGRCGKNEYGQATFWHDFDTKAEGCTLDADVFKVSARVAKSAGVVAEKYPEYDRIYSDGVLNIVSIVGLDGWTDAPTDVGARVFERLVQDSKNLSQGQETVSGPRTEFIFRDLTIKGTLEAGKKYEHRVFLVSQAEHATPEFDTRFAAATGKADVVTYDGHSGLGKNIKAVTSRGTVAPGQYQLWFLDGCNTLGYVDTSFTERRREANAGADTKFVDLIGNALPSRWPWGESTTFKMLRSLSKPSAPKTYLQIISEFPSDQVTAVVGDEDNTYRP